MRCWGCRATGAYTPTSTTIVPTVKLVCGATCFVLTFAWVGRLRLRLPISLVFLLLCSRGLAPSSAGGHEPEPMLYQAKTSCLDCYLDLERHLLTSHVWHLGPTSQLDQDFRMCDRVALCLELAPWGYKHWYAYFDFLGTLSLSIQWTNT